jgi:voltage-gated potassium channel
MRTVRAQMPRQGRVERRMQRLLHEPPTVRLAASAIVTATASVVVAAGIAMRILDHDEYPNVWVGMWWAIQTVTTVGYGDVTPARVSGRLVAVVVMLQGIAFLAIVTAAITSLFVARASEEVRRQHELEDKEDDIGPLAHTDARFDELERRLERIEAALQARPGS